MGFIYETHLHTRQGSLCGVSRGADYIQRYIDSGFAGIIVTDHFFNSNTAADRLLPWKEWVKRFCEGFRDAQNEGARRGLDVFFGWEETFDGDDYLVYGLDEEWLLEHPELVRWTREEQFCEVKKSGGCVIQAHPFRQHDYIREMHLSPFLVDGIEAANAGNHDQRYDGIAREYARILGLPAAAGSDIHNAADIGKKYDPYGVDLDKKLVCINDYVTLILNKAEISLHIPQGRCDYREADGAVPLRLKTDLRDRRGRLLGPPRQISFAEIRDIVGRGG